METRRILLDGVPTTVERDGEELVAPDQTRIPLGSAEHLAPTEPTKIVCVHLNYESRVREFLARMPPAAPGPPPSDAKSVQVTTTRPSLRTVAEASV